MNYPKKLGTLEDLVKTPIDAMRGTKIAALSKDSDNRAR